MAYCTNSDVSEDFKNITFGATGNMTTTKIDSYITEADALINSYVGNKYAVPVTADTSAVALLKLFSRTLVRDRVRAVLEVKTTIAKDVDHQVRRDQEFNTSNVMKQLQAIRDGEMSLSGATLNVATYGFYSRNEANSECPTFKKNCKQW